MYCIGDVSKIVNISPNALRYYDEIGLLKPSLKQSKNQYRYYSEAQIEDIIFILELKQYGCTLDEIKLLLKDKSNEKLKAVLEKKREALLYHMENLKYRYKSLERRISKIALEDLPKTAEHKILIVDDLELSRKIIRIMLEEQGYTAIYEASNGEEAILAYEEMKPGLVIMDTVMPKLDGIDASRKIREKDKNAGIVMCSSICEINTILESLKAGARDFISKPISSFRLIHAVTKSFEKKHMLKTERINHISDMFEKNFKDTIRDKFLSQHEIDLFISKIIDETVQDEDIKDFLEKIGHDVLKDEEFSLNSPEKIGSHTMTYIKEKFSIFSSDFTSFLNNHSEVKLISVQNITSSEYKTMIEAHDNIGILKIKACSEPICFHVSGDFAGKKDFAKTLLCYAYERFNSILPSLNTLDMIVDLNPGEVLRHNYSLALISLTAEFPEGHKSIITIGLPHGILQKIKSR